MAMNILMVYCKECELGSWESVPLSCSGHLTIYLAYEIWGVSDLFIKI